jgi:ADP-ribosyl-[dinitrogen reductase] hydrolase
MKKRNYAFDILLGVAIGDALGVPVEFVPRKALNDNPVVDMRELGSHRQPKGTWSDDSSLTFCLAESLSLGYNLNDLAKRFVEWKQNAYWTAHDNVFDIGIGTSTAIQRLSKGVDPILAGADDEANNGNGSLMRILPLILYIKGMPIGERFRVIREVSSLTHRHIRSILACFIYLEMALGILEGEDQFSAFKKMQYNVKDFLESNSFFPVNEVVVFNRILANSSEVKSITDCQETEIYSSGYVVHTLEASIWCLLQTSNYKDAVLKAVNLGNDTDTTGAVTGGLAGLLYGSETIPLDWLSALERRTDIEILAQQLQNALV